MDAGDALSSSPSGKVTRPNAPVEIVRAAKASLREPTRPVTPADASRRLFFFKDAGSRSLSSSSAATARPGAFPDEAQPSSRRPATSGRLPCADVPGWPRPQQRSVLGRSTSLAPLPAGAAAAAGAAGRTLQGRSTSAGTAGLPRLADSFSVPPATSPAACGGEHGTGLQDNLHPSSHSDSAARWATMMRQVLQQLEARRIDSSGTGQEAAGVAADVKRLEALVQEGLNSGWLGSTEAAAAVAADCWEVGTQLQDALGALLDHEASDVRFPACALVLTLAPRMHPPPDTSLTEKAAHALHSLSQSSRNDRAFLQSGVLALLADAVPQSAGEGRASPTGTLYLVAAMKNASTDAAIQRALLRFGAPARIKRLLLFMAQRGSASGGRQASQRRGEAAEGLWASAPVGMKADIAAQALGTLRNLTANERQAQALLRQEPGLLHALAQAGRNMAGHREVALGLARVLSKLSLSRSCQAAITSEPELLQLLVALLRRHDTEAAVVERLAFVAANLATECCQETRLLLARLPHAQETALHLLRMYSPRADDADAKAQAAEAGRAGGERRSGRQPQVDVLVKSTRWVANLAIHPQVGVELAGNRELVQLLTQLLSSFRWAAAQELLLNVAAALSNLTCYALDAGSALEEAAPRIAAGILPLVTTQHDEAIEEAARCLGNLARLPSARPALLQARVEELMVLLLDSNCLQVVASAAGALVNLSADAAGRRAVVRVGGAAAVAAVLDRTAGLDWEGARDDALPLASAACKAILNLAGEPGLDAELTAVASLSARLRQLDASAGGELGPLLSRLSAPVGGSNPLSSRSSAVRLSG